MLAISCAVQHVVRNPGNDSPTQGQPCLPALLLDETSMLRASKEYIHRLARQHTPATRIEHTKASPDAVGPRISTIHQGLST